MDARRLRGILRQGVLAPILTVGGVSVAARLAGVSVGLAVLGLSMVAAAGLTAVLVSDTRNMRPDTETEAAGDMSVDARNPVGVRNELSDTPEVSPGNSRVVLRYTAGLFLLAASLVLYLGGLFG